MKSFLATTAIVLLMGGSAYAAPAQFNTYQSQASDIDASKFIGETVYSSKTDVTPDQKVTADAQKDWDNIGDINEVVLGRDGAVKAVVIGVGGFLGMGEKNVAVSMKDIKFVKTGDGADDYSLVINSTKEALNAAPAYKTPDDVKAAMNAAKTTDMSTTAANPGLTAPADNDTAANTTTTTDMAKPADTASNTAADTTMTKPADTAKDQASTATKTNDTADKTAADTTMKKPADNTANQASNTTASDNNTDTTTTASTTNNNSAVTTAMDDNRTRLTPPTITREGYETAKVEELTADKLEGATVYGPKDEDVGKIDKLVMNDNGKGVKLFVLDVGGFLGIGAHQIAVTPQELNIERNAKGDDVRVYIDANKDALKAQPEYKTQ
jgi:hypothetical protein